MSTDILNVVRNLVVCCPAQRLNSDQVLELDWIKALNGDKMAAQTSRLADVAGQCEIQVVEASEFDMDTNLAMACDAESG